MANQEVREYLFQEYRDALTNSSVWIKMAFSTFLKLPNKIVLTESFLNFILGKDSDCFKVSQHTIEYGLSEIEGEKCGNCIYSYRNVVNNKVICSEVRGDISLDKWCKLHKN